MGKVRKLRQKYHLSKMRGEESAKDAGQPVNEKSEDGKCKGIEVPSTENIFAGLNITYDTLTKSLPQDLDARSVVSTKSRKEMKLEEQHLKKKIKLKLRRERFLQKLDVTQQAMRAAKKKMKKNSKDMCRANAEESNLLLESFPSLKSLLTDKSKRVNKEKKVKLKGILNTKKRIKQQTSDANLMKKILKDKKFKSNPGQTITEILKKKVVMYR